VVKTKPIKVVELKYKSVNNAYKKKRRYNYRIYSHSLKSKSESPFLKFFDGKTQLQPNNTKEDCSTQTEEKTYYLTVHPQRNVQSPSKSH